VRRTSQIRSYGSRDPSNDLSQCLCLKVDLVVTEIFDGLQLQLNLLFVSLLVHAILFPLYAPSLSGMGLDSMGHSGRLLETARGRFAELEALGSAMAFR
jgi:hypothetical protein